MMYNQKLVASLKANGKILREFKDTVYIPFGAEYSVLLKNLNTVKAIVNIFIDGDNVVPGGLVLNAGQEIDLERSIVNGNLREGNRFKFIERTSSIEQHRGIKLEDGLIRVEFQFEKPRPVINISDSWWSNHTHDIYGKGITRGIVGATYATNATSASADGFTLTASGATNISASAQGMAVAQSAPVNDVGITVPGSRSDQKFQVAESFITEPEKHNIVLKLLGEVPGGAKLVEPVTVKAKPKCVTCGHNNKATAKFLSLIHI
jgi:hypothetical protein